MGNPLNAQDNYRLHPGLDPVIYDDVSMRTANTGPPTKS